MADRSGLERRVAAVEPKVRAADAGQRDAHDGIGGLAQPRVGPVASLDATGLVEDGGTHGVYSAPGRLHCEGLLGTHVAVRRRAFRRVIADRTAAGRLLRSPGTATPRLRGEIRGPAFAPDARVVRSHTVDIRPHPRATRGRSTAFASEPPR